MTDMAIVFIPNYIIGNKCMSEGARSLFCKSIPCEADVVLINMFFFSNDAFTGFLFHPREKLKRPIYLFYLITVTSTNFFFNITSRGPLKIPSYSYVKLHCTHIYTSWDLKDFITRKHQQKGKRYNTLHNNF